MNRKLLMDNKSLMWECIRLRRIVGRYENHGVKDDEELITGLKLLESRIIEKNR